MVDGLECSTCGYSEEGGTMMAEEVGEVNAVDLSMGVAGDQREPRSRPYRSSSRSIARRRTFRSWSWTQSVTGPSRRASGTARNAVKRVPAHRAWGSESARPRPVGHETTNVPGGRGTRPPSPRHLLQINPIPPTHLLLSLSPTSSPSCSIRLISGVFGTKVQ